jgi:hypothetical protein
MLERQRLYVSLSIFLSWKLCSIIVSKILNSFLGGGNTDYYFRYYQENRLFLVPCSLCTKILGFKLQHEPARDGEIQSECLATHTHYVISRKQVQLEQLFSAHLLSLIRMY